KPPITRQMIKSVTPKASPEPTAETRNNTEEMTIVGTRPSLLAIGPANHAPTAQPSSAEETAKPCSQPPRLKSADSASTAPLMTEVSNPNRNPPMAAATDMPITRGLNRVALGASLTFFRTFLTCAGWGLPRHADYFAHAKNAERAKPARSTQHSAGAVEQVR